MVPRTLALALCICAALSLAIAEQGPAGGFLPAPKCKGVAARPGGWIKTGNIPDDVYYAIEVALVEGGNSTWVACDDPAPTTLAACTQVVAGHNYEIIAELTCRDVASTIKIHTTVYVPLPSSNKDAEVTTLDVLSIDGKMPATL